MRNRALASLLLSALMISLATPIASSAVKAGSACKTKSQTTIVYGKKYTCIKSGKKLSWSQGVVVSKPTPKPTSTLTPSATENPNQGNSGGTATVNWNWNDGEMKWVTDGVPPTCTMPIISEGAFLDFSKPVSILQPGQSRGGSYKPHGGLRWSEYGSYVSGVKITVPFDGVVVKAFNYTVEGIYQFGVNIVAPCGIMVRLGHMQKPSDEFVKILQNIPPATENDSREYPVNVPVKKGDVIATDVGMPPPATKDNLGTFIDFGLIDLRQSNPVLPSNYANNAEISYSRYAVCWYEGSYLSVGDRTIAAKLPFANGDGASDYCQRH